MHDADSARRSFPPPNWSKPSSSFMPSSQGLSSHGAGWRPSSYALRPPASTSLGRPVYPSSYPRLPMDTTSQGRPGFYPFSYPRLPTDTTSQAHYYAPRRPAGPYPWAPQRPGYGTSHVLPGQVSIVTSTAQPLSTESSLKKYHLEKLPWLNDLLAPGSNGSTLNFAVTKNGPSGSIDQTFIELELSTNTADDPPKEADGDKKCTPSTNNAEGLCVYVSRCGAAVNMTATTYPEFHCKVQNKYAGICCPADMVDVKSDSEAHV